MKAAILVLTLAMLVGCAAPLQKTKNTVSGDGLFGEFYRLTNTARIVGPVDGAYESFTYLEWIQWIPHSTTPTRPNAWDCDDFALEAMVETRRAYRARGKADSTPAIGIAIGKIADGFLGMKGGGLHALNIIHVQDHGWMFYEPQTKRTARVREALQEKRIALHSILF